MIIIMVEPLHLHPIITNKSSAHHHHQPCRSSSSPTICDHLLIIITISQVSFGSKKIGAKILDHSRKNTFQPTTQIVNPNHSVDPLIIGMDPPFRSYLWVQCGSNVGPMKSNIDSGNPLPTLLSSLLSLFQNLFGRKRKNSCFQ